MLANVPPSWKFLSGLSLPVWLSTVRSGDLGPSGWDESALKRRSLAFSRLGPHAEKNPLLPDNRRVLICHQVHSLRIVVLLNGQRPLVYTGTFQPDQHLRIERYYLELGEIQVQHTAIGADGELARLVGQQDADGIITDLKGVFAAVTVADCLPLLLGGRLPGQGRAGSTQVLGALHSGWGGTGILAVALLALFEAGVQDLELLFGPCIGPASYPVPPDRAEVFSRRFGEAAVVACPDGQPGLDLVAANQAILGGTSPCLAGLLGPQREGINYLGGTVRQAFANADTFLDPELYSFRRESAQNYGRMLAMIGPA